MKEEAVIIDMQGSSEKTAIYSTVGKFSLIGQIESDCITQRINDALFPLMVVLPCGCEYDSYDEFPSQTVECRCGKHKVVEYRLH